MEFISNTLGKQERLRHRSAIDEIFQGGKSISVYPYRVYFRLKAIQEPASSRIATKTLFGVGVGKRHFKKAVDRNRIKRLTREAYRLQKQDLITAMSTNSKNLDLFFVFTGKALPRYEECMAAMANALARIQKQVSGTS